MAKRFRKQLKEVEVEDKYNSLVIDLMGRDLENPSLFKLSAFEEFRNKASDLPVNIGGVHYNSEKEYWEATLNDYVQNKFAEEFSSEVKNKCLSVFNKLGQLPQTYLSGFKDLTQKIRSNTTLIKFENVLTDAIQSAASSILDTKAKEINTKYALDEGFITSSDYNNAMNDLKNLQTYFGTDYSVTPEILSVENKLLAYKFDLSKSILETASDLAEREGISLKEAIKRVGPAAEVEVPREILKEKEPTEIAEKFVEAAKVVPELKKKRRK